jgi:hypothetical protein
MIMLFILKHLKKRLLSFAVFFASVIPRLDRGIQRKAMDYPVKSDADLREESLRPDNDNHWNRVLYV